MGTELQPQRGERASGFDTRGEGERYEFVGKNRKWGGKTENSARNFA